MSLFLCLSVLSSSPLCVVKDVHETSDVSPVFSSKLKYTVKHRVFVFLNCRDDKKGR